MIEGEERVAERSDPALKKAYITMRMRGIVVEGKKEEQVRGWRRPSWREDLAVANESNVDHDVTRGQPSRSKRRGERGRHGAFLPSSSSMLTRQTFRNTD